MAKLYHDILVRMKTLYQISGRVLEGAKRGRNLGFPTANLALDKEIPEGIYAAEVFIGDKKYFAASFVGKAETFGSEEYKLESYLLDFSGDLYGKEITVKLYSKLRDNKKFNSVEELVEHMKKDVLRTREFFSQIS